MGITAVVLGVIGFVFCWVPFLGTLLALIAVILGIAGIAKGIKDKTGKGAAITGLIFGLLGLALSLVVTLPSMLLILGIGAAATAAAV